MKTVMDAATELTSTPCVRLPPTPVQHRSRPTTGRHQPRAGPPNPVVGAEGGQRHRSSLAVGQETPYSGVICVGVPMSPEVDTVTHNPKVKVSNPSAATREQVTAGTQAPAQLFAWSVANCSRLPSGPPSYESGSCDPRPSARGNVLVEGGRSPPLGPGFASI